MATMDSDLGLVGAAAGTLCCSWSGLVWLQGAHDEVKPSVTMQNSMTITISYLHSFHTYLNRSDVVDALVHDNTDVHIDTTALSWGHTVLLAMVMVLSKACACIGLCLNGPPWQPVERCAVALVWADSVDNLPGHLLRVYALPSAVPASAKQGIRQRLVLHPQLTLTWEGCGTSDSLLVLEAGIRAL